MCSLISAFVVRCLDSITPILAKSKISRLQLVCVAEQAGSSLTWFHTPENNFSHDLGQNFIISDLSVGQYIKQPNRKCNRLCVGKRCCDPQAVCSCGIHTGKYECVCPEGYYGNGLKGGCQGNIQTGLKEINFHISIFNCYEFIQICLEILKNNNMSRPV